MRDNHQFSQREMQELLRAAKRRASRGTITDKADYALVIFGYDLRGSKDRCPECGTPRGER